ncbi:MAG: beta-lactamase family protein [Actinobacteria bacterium]|nr:MAG: beta-lactamase family protein [Actinomycetota bacterium]
MSGTRTSSRRSSGCRRRSPCMSEIPERLAARLERLVRQAQREKRAPSISAAVLRDGGLIWETAVGAADVEAGLEATPDTQYRIGSITKTFTAAAIMQLRDASKLDLEDTLDRHVEGAAHTPTIRRLLSHASGLQRETQDDSWLSLRFAQPDELLETLAQAELVLPSGARFHYSNLAFALLGIVVERVSGVPYQDYVRERLFEPVGLTRVSFEPERPAAKGYLAQPYADGVWDTVGVETGAWASAGQLWGTAGDICRWGAFLADPDESVLAEASAEEMRTVQAIADHERWLSGYGLGLGLSRDGDRILAGHGGSMPGFIAVLAFSAQEKVAAAALTNESEADLSELGTARGRSRPRRGGSASRRPTTSSRCWGSGSWRRRDSCSAGVRGSSSHASTAFRTGGRPRSTSGRQTTAGARSRARSTARRSASCAGRTAPWSRWSGPATRSRARRDRGARPREYRGRSKATSHCLTRTRLGARHQDRSRAALRPARAGSAGSSPHFRPCPSAWHLDMALETRCLDASNLTWIQAAA